MEPASRDIPLNSNPNATLGLDVDRQIHSIQRSPSAGGADPIARPGNPLRQQNGPSMRTRRSDSLIQHGRATAAQLQVNQQAYAEHEMRMRPAFVSNEMAAPALGAMPLMPQPLWLDVRGNDVTATVRESQWAVSIFNQADARHMAHLAGHVASLANWLKHYEQSASSFPTPMHEPSWGPLPPTSSAADGLMADLAQWQRNPTGPGLCELLLNDFKVVLDDLAEHLATVNPSHRRIAREQPFFTDRGRIELPDHLGRRLSISSRHAGIVDTTVALPAVENFFSGPVDHYKGSSRRDPYSATARQYAVSGTPFVGGASGTIETILMVMAQLQPLRSLDEVQQRESLLGLYTAMSVAAGHHSVIECILPAQAHGYFANIPYALAGPGGYAQATAALQGHFSAIGLNPGVSLS